MAVFRLRDAGTAHAGERSMHTSTTSLLSRITLRSLSALLLLFGVACAGLQEPEDSEETASASASAQQPLSVVVGQNIQVSADGTMVAQNQPAAATSLSHPGHLLI